MREIPEIPEKLARSAAHAALKDLARVREKPEPTSPPPRPPRRPSVPGARERSAGTRLDRVQKLRAGRLVAGEVIGGRRRRTEGGNF